MARTLSSPWVCWVIPMPQTKTARSARPTISAKARISSRETPAAFSSSAKGMASRRALYASKPAVWARMNPGSTQPSSSIHLAAPWRKAMSPPGRIWKKRSAILVPKRALSRSEGTK